MKYKAGGLDQWTSPAWRSCHGTTPPRQVLLEIRLEATKYSMIKL
jgi:hypothetical protein